MKVLPCGTGAVLLDCADLGEARRLHAAFSVRPEVVEAVLGARTVLLRGHPPTLRALAAAGAAAVAPEPPPARTHVIDVTYDGEDLAAVAETAELSVGEVVAAHTGTPWTVAFAGFAPGFAYLAGGDPRLAVPRRATPRPAVPAGAVALASEFSAIYPRKSPGGWQLIGHTDAVMFDTGRTPAALLAPGDTVIFRHKTHGRWR